MAKGLASSHEAMSATVVGQKIYDIFLCDPSDRETRLNCCRDIQHLRRVHWPDDRRPGE